jgi:hypothetical protein
VALLYNIVILAVDIAAVLMLCRFRGLLAWCMVVGCLGIAALLLGGFLGWRFENHFGVIRLWSYGIFLHGPVVLAATAILWRRSRPWLACGAAFGVVALIGGAADCGGRFSVSARTCRSMRRQQRFGQERRRAGRLKFSGCRLLAK